MNPHLVEQINGHMNLCMYDVDSPSNTTKEDTPMGISGNKGRHPPQGGCTQHFN